MIKTLRNLAIVLAAGCLVIWVGLWVAKKYSPGFYYGVAANVTGRDFVVPGTADPVQIAHPFWRGAKLKDIQMAVANAASQAISGKDGSGGLAGAAHQAAGETLQLVNINPATIVFTLINTAIIVALYFFLLHKPVMKILEERKEKIGSEMKAAEDAQAEAEAVKAEYAEKLKESKEEAAQIVAAAVKRAGERENQIIAEAQQEAASLKQKAEESIELEKKKAINAIKDQISDIVIMASEKVCEKEISKSDNEALINKFIAEVGNE